MAAPTQHQQYSSASLYVGNLHDDVNEALLYEIFREVGPIVSIRVCLDRESPTRKSLGYAYVNFQSPEDAERALDTLNFTTVKGKPIRIMWSQRDPSIRRSGVGNIFIKNLDPSIDHKSLYDTFSTFGNILSCAVKERTEKVKVTNEETGETEEKTVSKGYGFVHFETQQAADLAVSKMNGMLLNDKKVYVSPFMRKSERFNIRNTEKDFTNLYIKNLDPSVTTEDLLELFGKYGPIQNGVVKLDDKGVSRGFGFVNFEKHEDAVRALKELHDSEYKGQKLYVARFQSRYDRNNELRSKFEAFKSSERSKFEGRNLYVKNLDESFDDEKLKQEFSKYGEITSAVIMKDEKGQSRGFGFVCFSTPEEANRAITDMSGKMVGAKPLYVALAQKKEERQAELAARHRRQFIPMGGPIMGFPYPQAPFFPHQGPMGRGFPPQVMSQRWAQPHYRGGPIPNQPGGPMPYGGMRGGRGGARGSRGGKMRYTPNARNQRPLEENGGAPHQMEQPQPQQAPHAPEQGALTLANLSNLPHEEQKRVLGENIFPKVETQYKAEAGKITGMLLELDNSILLELIENPDALKEKVDEAMDVLKQAEAQQAEAEQAPQPGETATEAQ